jgi:hypothetical protein
LNSALRKSSTIIKSTFHYSQTSMATFIHTLSQSTLPHRRLGYISDPLAVNNRTIVATAIPSATHITPTKIPRSSTPTNLYAMFLPTGAIAGIAVGAVFTAVITAFVLILMYRRAKRRKNIRRNRASLIRTYGNEAKPYGVSVVVMEQSLKPRPAKFDWKMLERYEMPGVEIWQPKEGRPVVQELPGCYGVGR